MEAESKTSGEYKRDDEAKNNDSSLVDFASSSSGTFVTQASPAPKRLSTIRRSSNTKSGVTNSALKVVKVEDEPLKWLESAKECVPSLPPRVDFDILACTVADTLRLSSLRSRAAWRKQFSSKVSRKFVTAAFWWIFLDHFVKCESKRRVSSRAATSNNASGHVDDDNAISALEESSQPTNITSPSHSSSSTSLGFISSLKVLDANTLFQTKMALYNHLAIAFYEIFTSISPKRKDAFFSLYPDAVAQFIANALNSAYPSSKMLFDLTFKEEMYKSVSEWILGVTAPKSFDISHWSGESDRKGRGSLRRIMLDLDAPAEGSGGDNGCVTADNTGNSSALVLGNNKRAFEGKEEERADRANLVNIQTSTAFTSLEINHSPLIEHFLGRNACGSSDKHSFRMTQSVRQYRTLPHDYFDAELDGLSSSKSAQAGRPSGPQLIADEKPEGLKGGSGSKGSKGASDGRGEGNTSALALTIATHGDHLESKEGDKCDDLYSTNFSLQPETYSELVARTDDKRRRMIKRYKEQRAALSSELKAVQKNSKKQIKELEENKRKAIKGNIAELSNYLVSMWKVDDE